MISTLLNSQRLTLRAVTRADQQKVFEGFSHPIITKYFDITYSTFEATSEQIEWYEKNQREQTGQAWAIVYNDAFVGVIGIYSINWKHENAEIGYWLFPEYWKLGLATEALQTVLHHARTDLKLHRIYADIEIENTASKNMIRNCGFEHEGTKRECERKGDGYISLETWSVLFPGN